MMRNGLSADPWCNRTTFTSNNSVLSQLVFTLVLVPLYMCDCRIRHCVTQRPVSETIKSSTMLAVSVIELLLGQRRFRVHISEISSSWRVQKNGLPQGSVHAQTLFNLFINDLPATTCRNVIYADDIRFSHQARMFEDLNTTINADIAKISEYCKCWRLQPSVAKTVSSTFHLHNARINQELDIIINGKRLRHDNRPTYLGVTLDCMLTYKPHLRKAAAKTRTRSNLIHMLAGTTWGAGAETLRTSALALSNSVAE